MDVVYVVRKGENPELRYSLRSLQNVPHNRVWLFGGCPDWATNVTLVRTPQRGPKYGVTSHSVKAACLHPEVSDPFWLWNDDFFAVESAKPEHYHRGPVRDVLAVYDREHPTGIYTRGMRDTLQVLEARGISDPLSYELHVPIVVHKEPMLEALALGVGKDCWHKRTAYGNLANLGGALMSDVKVRDTTSPLPAGPWLSTSDQTFPFARRWLKGLFPEPSEFE